MTILKQRKYGWGIAAVLLWLLFPFVCVIIGLGSFLVPAKVPEWQAQGLKEPPVIWQIITDMADFCKVHWYLVFPLLLAGALFASYKFLCSSQQQDAA